LKHILITGGTRLIGSNVADTIAAVTKVIARSRRSAGVAAR